MQRLKPLVSRALVAFACAPALAQPACKCRGELDPQYCDGDKDRGALGREMASAEAAAKK